MAESYLEGDILQNSKGESIVLSDGQWQPLTAETVKSMAQSNIDAFNNAREQAKLVGADPLFQEMTREAGAEGRSMMLDAVKTHGPGVAASMATGGVGGAVPILGRGALGMLTRATGQGGAELVRQKMMGEETSKAGAGIAAGTSAVVDSTIGATGSLIKNLARKSPGVGARISQRELGTIDDFLGQNALIPDKAGVTAAYKQVNDLVTQHGNQFVQLTEFRPMVQGVIDEMERRPMGDMPKKVLGRFKGLMKQGPGSAPFQFDQVDGLLQDINAAIGSSKNLNEKRLLTEAKAKLWKDLENSPVAPEIKGAYQTAVRTARESFAREELGTAIDAGIKRSNVTGGNIVNPKAILEKFDDLKADKAFTGSFKPGELEKVETFFVKMAQAVRSSSPEGTGIVLGSLGGMLGAGAGSLAGAPGMGASIGVAAGVSLPQLFTKIALSPKQSELVLRMFATGKPIAQPILVALSNAGATKLRTDANRQ